MTPAQVVAFNRASGTSLDTLSSVIVMGVFVTATFWAVLLFIGKLRAFVKEAQINEVQIVVSIARVLAVVVIILILVSP